MTHPSNKATHKSSNIGGDKNPPHAKIDSSHKLPLKKKRKNIVGQAEEPKIESEHMHKFHSSADAMHHSSTMEIAKNEIFTKMNPSYSRSLFLKTNLKI
jgi:hypothetical protein